MLPMYHLFYYCCCPIIIIEKIKIKNLKISEVKREDEKIVVWTRSHQDQYTITILRKSDWRNLVRRGGACGLGRD